MTCPESIDLLSSRIDGEISASERVRLESHLGTCDACRRNAAQMERAVAWLRGLERLPAPPPAVNPAQLPVRRVGWGAVRPLALAASAVLAALLAWEGFDALFTDPPPAPASARKDPAGAVAAAPDPAGGSRSLPVPAVEPRAGGPMGSAPEVPLESSAAPTDSREPRTTAAEPGLATPQATPEVHEEPVYARIHGSPPAAEGQDSGANLDDRAAASPGDNRPAPASRPEASAGATVWIPQPDTGSPAAKGATPATAGTGRPASPTRTSVAPPAPARPAPIEVASSIPVIAWVDDDAVRFADTDDAEPGDLLRADGVDASTEEGSGSSLERRADEIPRPDADPRTGVTPPVPLERPRTLLHTAPDPETWRLLPALSLQVTIAGDGSVVGVTALPWPGPAWIAASLTKAVRGWTFLPAERAGAAVTSRVEVAIEFDAR